VHKLILSRKCMVTQTMSLYRESICSLAFVSTYILINVMGHRSDMMLCSTPKLRIFVKKKKKSKQNKNNTFHIKITLISSLIIFEATN